MFSPFAPISLIALGSGFSDTICTSPCLLLCCILDTSFRLTNRCRIIFSAPNLLAQQAFASHYGACLSTLHDFSSHHSLKWTQTNSFFQLLTLVFGCPLSPLDRSGLFQKHFLYILRSGQSTLMSTATCPSNIKVCHCGHLMPKSRV